MKIISVALKNFRGFRDVSISFDSLSAFVGKNNEGKSSILEALDIFFGEEVVKFSSKDINVLAVQEDKEAQAEISVTFKEIPNEFKEVLITKNIKDSLDGDFLKISQKWKFNEETKRSSTEYFIGKQQQNIKTNAYKEIKEYLPLYCLFVSDRNSDDSNEEVQDPFFEAIQRGLNEQEEKIKGIENEVKKALQTKIDETLKLLNSENFSFNVDKNLMPNIEKINWSNAFKQIILQEEQTELPLNKKGSGIKRLILLGFFINNALSQAKENQKVIFAFEEIESAQHITNQIKLKALLDYLIDKNHQVIITTHSPHIVRSLSLDNSKGYTTFRALNLVYSKNHQSYINNLNEKNKENTLLLCESSGANMSEILFLIFDKIENDNNSNPNYLACIDYHQALYGQMVHLLEENNPESKSIDNTLKDFKDFQEKRQKEFNPNIIRLIEGKGKKKDEKYYRCLSHYLRNVLAHPEADSIEKKSKNQKELTEQILASISDMREFFITYLNGKAKGTMSENKNK
ncbi:ATP-dependent nuclease [Helicobacter cetorum]|uniref:ATP-dependent nuclease n=1 Tax=Helicobacter cetorum TaxID=138563 RepID=UPI000CF09B0F|nr:AAA family ATPase [Helicobacter cetorum]